MAECTAKLAPAWRSLEDALLAATEELGIGAARVSLDGKWLAVNKRLCEMLGHSEDEILKIPFDRFFQLPTIGTNSCEKRVMAREAMPTEFRTAIFEIRDAASGEPCGFWLPAASPAMAQARRKSGHASVPSVS